MARVGISGWSYPPWRGDFYPKGLLQRSELAFAASKLNSIEINGTFYALQKPPSFFRWGQETPDDFVFSVKGPRFITHMKKLRDVDVPLANFFASGVLALGDKLGPILWQLPPTLAFEPERIQRFIDGLPRSTGEAAYLARRHDERLTGRSWTGALADRPLRHCIEVRHESYRAPAFLAMARSAAVAVVVAETAGKWPQLLEVTADFVYARLHGAAELYTSGYTPDELAVWAGRVRDWEEAGQAVYVYFDNDVKVRAPYDAQALQALLTAPLTPHGASCG
jgi:uncharacterized protein YecE (DUF72 family)